MEKPRLNRKSIGILALILLFYLYFLRLVSFSYLSVEPHPITVAKPAFPGENYFKWDGQVWGVIPELAIKSLKGTEGLWQKKIYMAAMMAAMALFIALVPVIIFSAALNFELRENEALTAAFSAALYWLFDPVLHNCWFWGQAAWPLACVSAVWALSFFYRLKTDASFKYICFGLGIFSLSSHLLVTVFLFPVWLAIGHSSSNKPDKKLKKVIISVIAFLIVMMVFFRLPAELKKTVSFFKITLVEGVKEIIKDHKPLLPLPLGTHVFKMLIGLFGFYGIIKWKQDRKYLPFFYGTMILFILTYLSGITQWLDFLSPYRFGIPLFFLLIFPAAVILVRYFQLFNRQNKTARLVGLSVWLLLLPAFFSGGTASMAYPRLAAAAAFKFKSRYKQHWENGQRFEKQKKETKAVEEYKQALKAKPGDHKSRFRLGRIYLKHWNLRKANRLLREVIELKPDYYQAYGALGVLYMRSQDRKSAQRMFNKVLELKPDNYAAKRYLYRLKEGWKSYQETGK